MISLATTIGERSHFLVYRHVLLLLKMLKFLYVCLAEMLLRRIKEAADQRLEQREAFDEYNAAIPADDSKKWAQEILTWESDQTKRNPFVSSLKGKLS